jgi:hypothetical protein
LILTGSQLLFFKDVSVASTFMGSHEGTGIRTVNIKPDELVSLQDAVALCDTACSKVICRSLGLHPSADISILNIVPKHFSLCDAKRQTLSH